MRGWLGLRIWLVGRLWSFRRFFGSPAFWGLLLFKGIFWWDNFCFVIFSLQGASRPLQPLGKARAPCNRFYWHALIICLVSETKWEVGAANFSEIRLCRLSTRRLTPRFLISRFTLCKALLLFRVLNFNKHFFKTLKNHSFSLSYNKHN